METGTWITRVHEQAQRPRADVAGPSPTRMLQAWRDAFAVLVPVGLPEEHALVGRALHV